jgi:hypothetical protein
MNQLNQVAAHPNSFPLGVCRIVEEGERDDDGGDNDELQSASFPGSTAKESFSEEDDGLPNPSLCCCISEAVISASSDNKDTLLSVLWNAYGNARRVKSSHMSHHRGKF